VIAEGEEVVVYRAVLTANRAHPDFVRSFMSRAALGKPPRPGTPEERDPSLADGVSAFRTRNACRETVQNASKRGIQLGEFTAELHLVHEMGAEIEAWGARGHLTIWCDPLILAAAVASIVSIDEEI
jgi:hypothetical protein